MRRSDIDARLADLYAQVAQPTCKGLCADSCGPIDMHPRERQRIREHGVTIPHHDDALDQLDATGDYACPALQDGQCSVYSVRPMICRLWGAVEAMPCPHGCRPAGGLHPDQRGAELLNESLSIGAPDDALLEQRQQLFARLFADPQWRRTYQDYVRRHRQG
jgi:hypothetical protein